MPAANRAAASAVRQRHGWPASARGYPTFSRCWWPDTILLVALIEVEQLVKEFRRPKRFEGRLGGLRTLLTRQYVTTRAVDEISFKVEPGELVGYLGPNGAGKSTTIKMLTGILAPDSGSITVAGVVPWRERERNARQIGVVFGQRSQLWWDLPLRESFDLVRQLYDVSLGDYRLRIRQFSDLLGLDEFLEKPVRQLSLGQRMRGDLAAAMLYRPRILYLDEPTIGLDVVAKERIRVFIEELNRDEGTTIILTTHDLDDVERLCRRIMMIDHGKVLYDDDPGTLKARYAPSRQLVVRLADPITSQLDLQIDGVSVDSTEMNQVTFGFNPAEVDVADVMSAVLSRCTVSDISIVEPELEPIIRKIYADRAVL
jgi:ABC-2 type transport system ATP-binding protein